MDKNLIVSKSIDIQSSAAAVWSALTEPEKIKVYLFGTETITDWQVGSPIVFQGEYNGTQYKDKGNVLEHRSNELLKYNYWSGFSGLPDEPENYFIVSYSIQAVADGVVRLTWHQQGFSSEQGYEHTEKTLPDMLEQIKQLVEGQAS